VSSSPAFKWLVIVLVPLTLGWKLIGGETPASEWKNDIFEFLSRHGFEVTKRTWGDVPFSDATAGACRMIVVEVSPDGWTRDIFARFPVQQDSSSLSFVEALTRNNRLG
jgi:hypothetical protein